MDAHLMAKFYSLNPNIEDDLERVLSEAINEEQISNQVVDGTQPLPVDKRLGNVYQYAEKVIGGESLDDLINKWRPVAVCLV